MWARRARRAVDVTEPAPLRCLGKDWVFPQIGHRKSFLAMPPPQGIDRMWLNHLLMTFVTATPDRLVMSVWFPCLSEEELTLHQTKIAAAFGVDADRPGWVWQKGNDLLPTMLETGHPWCMPILDNGQAAVYAWHLTKPNSPVADVEVVRRVVRERLAGLRDEERN